MPQSFHLFIGHKDDAFREEIVEALGKTFIVSASSSSCDILNEILHAQPDLAILDYEISEIDVLNICEKLSLDSPQINTVIYVSVEKLQIAKKKWRCRALDYIVGPVTIVEFIEDVNKVVRAILIDRERERLVRQKVELRCFLNGSIARIKEHLKKAHGCAAHSDSLSELMIEIEVLEEGIKDIT